MTKCPLLRTKPELGRVRGYKHVAPLGHAAFPCPNAFIEFWRYSHPPIAKRIPFALTYKPWEQRAK